MVMVRFAFTRHNPSTFKATQKAQKDVVPDQPDQWGVVFFFATTVTSSSVDRLVKHVCWIYEFIISKSFTVNTSTKIKFCANERVNQQQSHCRAMHFQSLLLRH